MGIAQAWSDPARNNSYFALLPQHCYSFHPLHSGIASRIARFFDDGASPGLSEAASGVVWEITDLPRYRERIRDLGIVSRIMQLCGENPQVCVHEFGWAGICTPDFLAPEPLTLNPVGLRLHGHNQQPLALFSFAHHAPREQSFGDYEARPQRYKDGGQQGAGLGRPGACVRWCVFALMRSLRALANELCYAAGDLAGTT